MTPRPRMRVLVAAVTIVALIAVGLGEILVGTATPAPPAATAGSVPPTAGPVPVPGSPTLPAPAAPAPVPAAAGPAADPSGPGNSASSPRRTPGRAGTDVGRTTATPAMRRIRPGRATRTKTKTMAKARASRKATTRADNRTGTPVGPVDDPPPTLPFTIPSSGCSHRAGRCGRGMRSRLAAPVGRPIGRCWTSETACWTGSEQPRVGKQRLTRLDRLPPAIPTVGGRRPEGDLPQVGSTPLSRRGALAQPETKHVSAGPTRKPSCRGDSPSPRSGTTRQAAPAPSPRAGVVTRTLGPPPPRRRPCSMMLCRSWREQPRRSAG